MSTLKEFNLVIRNQRTQDYLLDVLGDKNKKAAYVANITALMSNDKALQPCEPMTVIYAGITATTLDLPLDKNLGFAYVIPYKNGRTGKSEAQFQLGYKGLLQLAIRSGQFTRINVSDVREGELQGVDRLTGDFAFKWLPDAERLKAEVVGYVAFFSLTNGFSKTHYMSRAEIEQHATRYSQTYRSHNQRVKESSKWSTDFDAMAKKTVLKLLLSKFAPLSVDMQRAVKADQSVQRNEGEYTYVDNDKTATRDALASAAAEAALASAAAEAAEVEAVEVTEEETETTEPTATDTVDPETGEVTSAGKEAQQ